MQSEHLKFRPDTSSLVLLADSYYSRLFIRVELSRTTKTFQLELRLACQICRIYFLPLNLSHFDIVQKLKLSKFSLPKNYKI